MQVIETGMMRVLIPDKGYKLVNKDTGKQMNKVYLGKFTVVSLETSDSFLFLKRCNNFFIHLLSIIIPPLYYF